MKRRSFTVWVLMLALVVCTDGFPLRSIYSPGIPVEQQPDWPAGLADLLNCPNRVYGYVGGYVPAVGYDFFFAGDAEDFNDFIERYARDSDEKPLFSRLFVVSGAVPV